MAPVLQCPDCGTKHPLGEVPDTGSFACKGCGRQLKVPEMAPRGVGTDAPGPARAVPPVTGNPTTAQPSVAPQPAPATQVLPVVERNPPPASRAPSRAAAPVSALASVPLWMRALLWIVALPLAFILVFGFARAIGVLTTNQITDIWLAPGSDRFWPVARLLPFVALLTAAFVQGGIVLLSRRHGRTGRRQPA